MGITGKYLDESGNIVEVIEWSVYILLNENKVVYIGCTKDIEKRILMHKSIKREFDSYSIMFQSYNKFEALRIEALLIRYSNLFTDLKLSNKNVYSSWGKTIVKV